MRTPHKGLQKFFELMDTDMDREKAFKKAGSPTTVENAMRAYKKYLTAPTPVQ